MRNSNFLVRTIVLGSFLLGQSLSSALASSIDIVNAGFEDDIYNDGDYGPASGWTEGYYVSGSPTWVPSVYRLAGSWNPDTLDGYPGGNSIAGDNAGWTESSISYARGLSQTLGDTLQLDTEYVLSAYVGNPFYNGSDTIADYRIELLAGGVVIASDTGSSPSEGEWALHSLIFNTGSSHAGAGGTLGIRLIGVAYADGRNEVDWDEVSLTAVPVPAAVWLFGTALLCFVGMSRRTSVGAA